ncbi:MULTISPECIES: filamentous hemagglutinin N-terminal domain-containing protein [Fischerella]|uniref:Filamentous haemagglutinin FhaB/tRNA nuclease CdiA-like TPS domain-containing protein n=1 Tax=Fischerella muscicola CCMEE 5323 TaxID=2019572 RepID=A0A2N6K0F4_FISMU|nr:MULTISPECIES: filamentous hemagglutinin N-terminal domain-containing protein [Fischerella]MBD2434025.1 filamentous hemagglutinin N-terminal domain-containing protein [Fischerella sp. FACHB-380]PLZ87549.1 hypothetical protein CEN44_17245 [Fischerella muscicola CCMEE 5323]
MPVAILETLAFITIAEAQIIPDNSLGAESSIVNPDVIKGIPSDRIDGGAIRGSNLFHSFQEFNVGEGRGAYFSNPANITNILTRVTGGNPSNILGKLGVLGNANLFLLNPKGIFFGPNASLDLGGSFFGTTADSFIFNNNFEFSATDPQAPPLLTVNVPIGLRFRNNPGIIANQSIAQDANNNVVGLQVQPGNSLALVGGNINLSDGGRLTATGGSIELGGLATSGTVGLDVTGNNFKLNFPTNILLSDITLSNARVQNNLFPETTGTAGDVNVTANNLSLINGGQISASTYGKGNAGRVIINATNNISASGEDSNGSNSGIFSRVYSTEKGDAGGIEINTKDLSLTDGAVISASTFGNGNAGRVIINASGNITADGEDQDGFVSGIFSIVNPSSVGNAGGIEIKTNNLSLTNGAVINASTLGQGNAGSVIINATGNITASGKDQEGFGSGIYSVVASSGVGDAGGIKINARSLSLSNGATLTTDSEGTGAAGNIEVTTAKDIRLDNRASITANTTGGQGNIILNSRDLILRRNSIIQTNARGTVQGGNISILTGNFVALGNSDISANAEKGFGGNVFIQAAYRFSSPDSDITATSDLGTQFGGTVRINTTDINPSQGLVQLPNNLTDPGDQIAQNPCQKGTGSAFIITGRGGLPSSPNENFSSDNVRVDLAQPVTSSSSQTATINQPKTSATTKQIVPAQGWIFNEKGEVVLTAYDVTSRDFQRLHQNSGVCRAF